LVIRQKALFFLSLFLFFLSALYSQRELFTAKAVTEIVNVHYFTSVRRKHFPLISLGEQVTRKTFKNNDSSRNENETLREKRAVNVKPIKIVVINQT
jgi:hypothetical protein